MHVTPALSGPGSLTHPGLESNPEAQGIDRPKIDPGHTPDPQIPKLTALPVS